MKNYLALLLGSIPATAMSDEQKISPPTSEDQQVLDTQRALIEEFLAPSDLATKYKTAAGKLGMLRAILAARVFTANQTYELQSLGVVLGDAFVTGMGFHWIIVEDVHGRDFAVKYEDTSIIAFPLTMISKRIERHEEVDVFDLYNQVVDQVQALAGEGGR